MGSFDEPRPEGKSSALNAATGSELTILIKDMNLRFKGTLIGLYPENYLIVRTAQTTRVINWFDVSRELIVRYAYDGDVYRFDTSVIHTSRKPEKLLFLKYPKFVQKTIAGVKERVDLLVQAGAEINGPAVHRANFGHRFRRMQVRPLFFPSPRVRRRRQKTA